MNPTLFHLDDAGYLALAASLHQGQFLKSGKPYIIHPARVGALMTVQVEYTSTRQIGYLHDTIEDCGVTEDDLISMGAAPRVARAVSIVSKKDNEHGLEQYDNFITRIIESSSNAAILVKLADVCDHLMADPENMPAAYIAKQKETFERLRLCLRDHHVGWEAVGTCHWRQKFSQITGL